MTWLKRKVIHWCLKDAYGLEFETKKLTDRQRMVALKDAYNVDNFMDLLNKYTVSFTKKAGLTAEGDEVWFYRGAIFFGQMLTKSMKRSNEEWCKIQEEALNK